MKGIIILADHFEDVEAIATIDVLRRAKLEIKTVSTKESLEVRSQSGITVKAEKLMKDIDVAEYDFLVIPGGKAVSESLVKNEKLNTLIKAFVFGEKLVATICAAPSLVGKLGFFGGKKFTCFPGFEKDIDGKYTAKEIEVVDNFITARSMYYSLDFGVAIIEKLLGKDKAKEIIKSIQGLK